MKGGETLPLLTPHYPQYAGSKKRKKTIETEERKTKIVSLQPNIIDTPFEQRSP